MSAAATHIKVGPRSVKPTGPNGIMVHIESFTTVSPAPGPSDLRVLRGLDWAIANECETNVMSLVLNEFTMFLFLVVAWMCVVLKHGTRFPSVQRCGD